MYPTTSARVIGLETGSAVASSSSHSSSSGRTLKTTSRSVCPAQRKILDGSLGFAAGVMLAASFWSLLAPAIEIAESAGGYGRLAFIPVGFGFFLGALFVYAMDKLIPSYDGHKADLALAMQLEKKSTLKRHIQTGEESALAYRNGYSDPNVQLRKKPLTATQVTMPTVNDAETAENLKRWKRIFLLVVAVTVHNIPEGLAVGVGFGAAGSSEHSTFETARNLALGIGIQNFPEGLAVSLPLRGAGFSKWKSFWYGQLSGVVEPAAGILGCLAVTMAQPLLPYALAFAAGAMVYVVVDDIVPEAQACSNGRLASWTTVVGFIVMMALDVGLS
ncbi:zinc/iron regulated transporter-related protein 48C isoform X1 [Dermacentor variabilis]|uniref:zinc/iron regulated transporter-related protein 48C isoform X1 n=1 Tax=Dermacentor variabilis TaxID=34621 RepID=UPI003F5AEFAD